MILSANDSVWLYLECAALLPPFRKLRSKIQKWRKSLSNFDFFYLILVQDLHFPEPVWMPALQRNICLTLGFREQMQKRLDFALKQLAICIWELLRGRINLQYWPT